MITLLSFFLTLLVSLLKSKSRLEAENTALRHQLIILRRKVRGRVQLTNGDRLFFIQLYRWFPSVLKAFVAPTIGLDLLCVLVIIRLERRDLLWINVTPHPTAEWIAREVTEAFPWAEAPRYLIRDRDRVYGAAVMRRKADRINPSRHIVVLGEAHLRRTLTKYATYYNELRTHRSLGKDAPIHPQPTLFCGARLPTCPRMAAS